MGTWQAYRGDERLILRLASDDTFHFFQIRESDYTAHVGQYSVKGSDLTLAAVHEQGSSRLRIAKVGKKMAHIQLIEEDSINSGVLYRKMDNVPRHHRTRLAGTWKSDEQNGETVMQFDEDGAFKLFRLNDEGQTISLGTHTRQADNVVVTFDSGNVCPATIVWLTGEMIHLRADDASDDDRGFLMSRVER